ncbi:MAG: ribonuclease HII [Candidatus Iainarchaeum sp.]|jgi:ribonuclease HII|nr:MAG: Ribonuclease HII [archaeon ADurb.Bin336]
MLIAGIDEAGRGPCFGPMTIAISVMDKENEKQLKVAGVKDSKLLLPAKREALIKEVTAHSIEHQILVLEPIEINDLMTQYSLNEIEAMKVAELINNIKSKIDVVYVDSPDAVKGAFEKRIRKYLNKKNQNLKIVAENKADAIYTVVGAASILAKVKRDALIEELCEKYGDFGSGYPSDPKTQKFLEDYVKEKRKLPPFSRIFWKTCTNALNKVDQKRLDNYA